LLNVIYRPNSVAEIGEYKMNILDITVNNEGIVDDDHPMLWANVSYEINDAEYNASVQFDCGNYAEIIENSCNDIDSEDEHTLLKAAYDSLINAGKDIANQMLIEKIESSEHYDEIERLSREIASILDADLSNSHLVLSDSLFNNDFDVGETMVRLQIIFGCNQAQSIKITDLFN
jgi:hypothetical protein